MVSGYSVHIRAVTYALRASFNGFLPATISLSSICSAVGLERGLKTTPSLIDGAGTSIVTVEGPASFLFLHYQRHLPAAFGPALLEISI